MHGKARTKDEGFQWLVDNIQFFQIYQNNIAWILQTDVLLLKKKALKLNNLINKLFAQFSDTSSVDIDSSKIANSGVNHPE